MNFLKMLFICMCVCVSSLSFSAEDKIYSSSSVKGNLRAYFVQFKIRLRKTDQSGDKQEPYGVIELNTSLNSDPPTFMPIWHITDNGHLGGTEFLYISGTVYTSDVVDNPYINIGGFIKDDDGDYGDDKLCNIDYTYKIYASTLGTEDNAFKHASGLFHGGDGDCHYLQLLAFEPM